jgi:hypothetical protein
MSTPYMSLPKVRIACAYPSLNGSNTELDRPLRSLGVTCSHNGTSRVSTSTLSSVITQCCTLHRVDRVRLVVLLGRLFIVSPNSRGPVLEIGRYYCVGAVDQEENNKTSWSIGNWSIGRGSKTPKDH